MLKELLISGLIGFSQSAQVTQFHPPISPSFDDDVLSDPLWTGIAAYLPTKKYTANRVMSHGNQIPHICFDGATNWEFHTHAHTWDISVYEVTYEDCDVPLLVCHEDSAETSLDEFLQTISRVPSNMRTSWKTVLLGQGGHDDGCGCSTASGLNGSSTACFGSCGSEAFSVLYHENCHANDFVGNGTKYWYTTDIWTDAYSKDTKQLVNDTNAVEYWADVCKATYYDVNVPDNGLKNLVSKGLDLDAIRNQINAMKTEMLPGRFLANQTCYHKVTYSAITWVDKGTKPSGR